MWKGPAHSCNTAAQLSHVSQPTPLQRPRQCFWILHMDTALHQGLELGLGGSTCLSLPNHLPTQQWSSQVPRFSSCSHAICTHPWTYPGCVTSTIMYCQDQVYGSCHSPSDYSTSGPCQDWASQISSNSFPGKAASSQGNIK